MRAEIRSGAAAWSVDLIFQQCSTLDSIFIVAGQARIAAEYSLGDFPSREQDDSCVASTLLQSGLSQLVLVQSYLLQQLLLHFCKLSLLLLHLSGIRVGSRGGSS